MTATTEPKGVELLALPWCLLNLPASDRAAAQDYARANVEASVAELRAEVARLRADRAQGVADYQMLRDFADRETVRAERLAEALRWYAEQASLCRKLGAAGDEGRQALDADGGSRARQALTPPRETGRDGPWLTWSNIAATAPANAPTAARASATT